MVVSPSFAEIVAAAKRHTPGGVLTQADKDGLIKRGIAMNMSAVDILATLNTPPDRHPITRGIE
jgi:hypothetical protein